MLGMFGEVEFVVNVDTKVYDKRKLYDWSILNFEFLGVNYLVKLLKKKIFVVLWALH